MQTSNVGVPSWNIFLVFSCNDACLINTVWLCQRLCGYVARIWRLLTFRYKWKTEWYVISIHWVGYVLLDEWVSSFGYFTLVIMWSPQVCFLASFHLFIDIRAPFSFSLKVSVAHQQTMISANWSILFGLVLNIPVKERWGETFRRTQAHVKTTFNAHQFRNVKPNCTALYCSR